MGFLVDLFEHVADVGSAAVNDDRVDPDVLEKSYIVHDRLLQVFVDHGISAVLDNECLASHLPDIRK